MVSQDKTAAQNSDDKPMTLAQQMAAKAAEARRKGSVEKADVAEYDADGFRLVRNKMWLVGRGFLIMSTDYGVGEYGDEVVVTGVTHSGIPFRMRDASTGIFQQLSTMVDPQFPLAFDKGLRVSEYEYMGRPAKTFYLNDND